MIINFSLLWYSSQFYVSLSRHTLKLIVKNGYNNDPTLTTSEFSKNAESRESTGLTKEHNGDASKSAKLHLKRFPFNHGNEPRTHILDSTIKDLV